MKSKTAKKKNKVNNESKRKDSDTKNDKKSDQKDIKSRLASEKARIDIVKHEKDAKSSGEEEYEIESEGLKIKVKITGGKGKVSKYNLVVPEISGPTRALFNEIKHKLVTEVNVSAEEILDVKVMEKLKQKFKNKASELIKERLPGMKEETEIFLTGILLHEMLGLDKIEFLLSDPNLEEIIINCANEPVRAYHKIFGWVKTNVMIESEEKIQNFSNIIARRAGRQINILAPLLDAQLVTGDRANAVLYPIANKGNTITIRKFARDPWTITDLIANKTCDSNIFALIWLAIQFEMNILISGGTASGKTSFLNVCMSLIPPNNRVISIEDTRELQLPKYLYWCPLTTRLANPEGKGEVSMLDLLVNSLRMRPDRIILGEIRRKKEAEVLFEAMHTGHSVYATVHADSINETIQRLTNPPIEVPPNMISAVNLNVVMFRDRRLGIRKSLQVGEFLVGEEAEKVGVKPNILYRWKPNTNEFVTHATPIRFFEDLSRHTGMTQAEIDEDLAAKRKILDYMVKYNIRQLNDVGKIINKYYLDPEFVIDAVKKNSPPASLLTEEE
jgi:archaeal flagellar protein FlaI